MVRVVLGLGNPGRRYRDTRHNLGYRVVDGLCERFRVQLARKPKARLAALEMADRSFVLAKPRGYMNESGRAAEYLKDAARCRPPGFLVVLDDVELPLGTLRLRKSGRDGGHRGLRSVLEALGSLQVPRLRLGVGRGPSEEELPDFVLTRFEPREEPAVEDMVASAVECVTAVLRDGLDSAMNQFNRRNPG